MRWPWRVSRRPRPSAPTSCADWQTLPPIALSIPPHPVLLDPARFAATLASWRNPSFLTYLTHEQTPEAPSGLVHNLATPIPLHAPHTTLPTAPTPAPTPTNPTPSPHPAPTPTNPAPSPHLTPTTTDPAPSPHLTPTTTDPAPSP
ncbi:hypothetical protein AB0K48_57695, partial [Nonomuraea sp. NPDC055795]